MTAYYGDKIVKGVYFGTQNTNCITEIPQDIDLRFKEFVQPVLTENGTMGGDTFACDQSDFYTESSSDEQKAWYVFDGKFNGQEWQVNTVSLDTWYWLSWYNPTPIKISKVGVTNAAGQYSILAWKLQGSSDNSTWTDLTTGINENVSSVTTWYMEIPEEKQSFYKYYRIYCQPRSPTALMIRELTLTAVEPTIVLKSGSKVYVPNGVGVFDTYTVTSNIVRDSSYGPSDGKKAIILTPGKTLDLPHLRNVYSGTEQPSVIGVYWYDTTNNQVKAILSETNINPGCSLLLGVATCSGGIITSIDQVFNGFGFIGSTLFALPGVKGFNPNGFENGAYANRERILGNVAIYTNTYYVSAPAFGLNNSATARWSGGYEEVNELSDVINPLQTRRYYVKSENKIYHWTGSAWAQEASVFAGYLTMDSASPYSITSLTVNQVQPEKTARKINFIYKGSTRVYMDVPPVTFNVSSEIQKYVVPNGVNKLHVVCVASKGYGEYGGNGGKVECDLTVTQGQTLYITVGAIPENTYTASYNASDIRIGGNEYTNRVVVAGGGGSGGSDGSSSAGGLGGGLTGGDGSSNDSSYAGAGTGGTQTAGGAGGTGYHGSIGHHHDGEDGTLGMGGNGESCSYEGAHGAGGAGYYGGGSGNGSHNKAGDFTSGGGGGSSYTDSSLCSNVTHTQGFIAGEGYITLTVI